MAQAVAQKVIQGRRPRFLRLTIPGSAAPVTIQSLVDAHARMVKRDRENIVSIRILAQRVDAAVFVDREALTVGDDVADLQGGADAGKVFYVAATEVRKLFVAAAGVAAFDAVFEVIIG